MIEPWTRIPSESSSPLYSVSFCAISKPTIVELFSEWKMFAHKRELLSRPPAARSSSSGSSDAKPTLIVFLSSSL